MTSYRVVDCRTNVTNPREVIIDRAASPEDAARKAIGEVLVRSGRRADLRVQVYFQHAGEAISMVRLYTKAIDRALQHDLAGSTSSSPSRAEK